MAPKGRRAISERSKHKVESLFEELALREDEIEVEKQVLEISQELLACPDKVKRCHRYVMSSFFLANDDAPAEPPFSHEYRRLHRIPQDHLRMQALPNCSARLRSSVLWQLKKANGPKSLHQLLYAATFMESHERFGPKQKQQWDTWIACRHVAAGRPLDRLAYNDAYVIDWRSACVYQLKPLKPDDAVAAEHTYTHVSVLGVEVEIESAIAVTAAMELHEPWSLQDCYVNLNPKAQRSNRLYFKDSFEGSSEFRSRLKALPAAPDDEDAETGDEPTPAKRKRPDDGAGASEADKDDKDDNDDKPRSDKDDKDDKDDNDKPIMTKSGSQGSVASSSGSAKGDTKPSPKVPRSVLNIKGARSLKLSPAAVKLMQEKAKGVTA